MKSSYRPLRELRRAALITSFVLPLGGWAVCAPGRTDAPPEAIVRLTRTQAAHFQSALAALSEQGHTAFVAEGAPLKPTLTGPAVPDLSGGVPLSIAVAKIAAAYDYQTERQGPVFVLKKQYTDTHDLPSVTLEECRLSIADALDMAETFNPHVPEDSLDVGRDLMYDILSTLTPTQKQAMQEGSLHYGDLTPDQQAPVRRLILYEYVQEAMYGVANELVALAQAPTAALYTGDGRGHTNLYLEVHTDRGTRDLLPVKYGYTSAVEESMPLILPPAPKKSGESALPATTLGAVTAALSRRLPPKSPAMVVDNALRDKPVTVVGLDTAPPSDALRALANVYGLRIGVTKQGGSRLTRRGALPPTDLSEMAESIWAAIPNPYLRAMHVHESLPLPPPTPQANTLQAWLDAVNERDQRRDALERSPQEMSAAALQRLIVLIQPQIKAAGPNGRIPVSSLNTEARAVLAQLLTGNALRDINDRFSDRHNNGILHALADFDSITISGNPYPDPDQPDRVTCSILLTYDDPTDHNRVCLGGVG